MGVNIDGNEAEGGVAIIQPGIGAMRITMSATRRHDAVACVPHQRGAGGGTSNSKRALCDDILVEMMASIILVRISSPWLPRRHF